MSDESRGSACSPGQPRRLRATARALTCASLVFAGCFGVGCGGSSEHGTATTVNGAHTAGAGKHGTAGADEAPFAALRALQPKTPPPLHVTSVAQAKGQRLKARYTCKGADRWPQISWSTVPPSTKELLVFVRTLQAGPPILNWGVAALPPSLRHISEGELPGGAVIGRNSFGRIGYYLCPQTRIRPAVVSITIVAPSHRRPLRRGFNDLKLLDESTGFTAHDGSVVMVVPKSTGGGIASG
jgi:phosphatidylethanolamine-binding protein (PEBP) family uncharacterized protein